MIIAHVRSFLARHRLVHWALVASFAIGTAALVASRTAELDRRIESWGTSRTVWVAATDLAPGDAAVARATAVPVAVVAPGALDAEPVGQIARREVGAGEMLVEADLGAIDRLVPIGWRHVAIAADEATLPVDPGDRVDVVAAGSVLAADGIVVQVGPAAVVVAVEPVSAPAVAAAALDRTAVLVGHG